MKNAQNNKRIKLSICACLLLSAISCLAAESSDDIVNSLLPKSGYRNIVIEGELEPVTAAPSISVPIVFEYSSAKLSAESKNTLDTIAKALNHPKLQSCQFMLEGHTDGKGSNEVNQTLSIKRANAVKEYLSQKRKIEPQRLLASGKGASELLLPNEPWAAANRRVKFINLGSIEAKN